MKSLAIPCDASEIRIIYRIDYLIYLKTIITMKKIIVLGLLAFTVSGIIRSQITFTVKPGLNLNSANIGIKSENFLPYFGLQFLNIT